MSTWNGASLPAVTSPTLSARLAGAIRGAGLGLLLAGGLIVLMLCRVVERALYGAARPATPRITRWVCRRALPLLGLRHVVVGRPLDDPGALVANHASWLDIFALNACTTVTFVSKSEVADWPAIGWLARATGTVFIRRDRRDAAAQTETLARRIQEGARLVVFPEGTSTDGARVLHFKSTLFAAFFAPQMPRDLAIQPVTLHYDPPPGEPAAFYAWWGDMEFGPHLWRILTAPRGGQVTVTFHETLRAADFDGRKALAGRAETLVRGDLPSE